MQGRGPGASDALIVTESWRGLVGVARVVPEYATEHGVTEAWRGLEVWCGLGRCKRCELGLLGSATWLGGFSVVRL